MAGGRNPVFVLDGARMRQSFYARGGLSALIGLGIALYATYRYLFDRTKEFKRARSID